MHDATDYHTGDGIYWETAAANGLYSGHEQEEGTGSFSENYADHAFELTYSVVATPRPGIAPPHGHRSAGLRRDRTPTSPLSRW